MGGLALVGCGSVVGNTGDASTDHATGGSTGSAGAAGGSTGSAGAAAGSTGSAGAAAGSTGSAGATGGSPGSAGATAGSTGSAGAAAGAGGTGADRCERDVDCAAGVCWQQLDGVRVCVAATTPPMPVSCQFAGTPCCMSDADCIDKAHGHCVPKSYFPGCGGALPAGNVCTYDGCAADADCKAGMPAGATVATCLPAIQGRVTKTCAYGGCRTNADCTKHPGGACQYGLGPTHGQCVLIDVFFCAYPSDPCPAQACPAPQRCVPNDNYQGRQCGPGPPMYP